MLNLLLETIEFPEELNFNLQNEIIFINKGSTVATVNGLTIGPLQSFGISGNVGEVYAEDWNISFAGGTGILSIIEKKYLV